MTFQKPFIEYVCLSPQNVIVSSPQSAGGTCQVNGAYTGSFSETAWCGDGMYVDFPYMTKQEFCENVTHGDPDFGSYFQGYGVDEGEKIQAVNPGDKDASKAVVQATAAPARTTTHFNNDLFN